MKISPKCKISGRMSMLEDFSKTRHNEFYHSKFKGMNFFKKWYKYPI